MRWFGWFAVAVLAGISAGCSDGDALYTSSKYVPGYTPSGATELASARPHDGGRSPVDWQTR